MEALQRRVAERQKDLAMLELQEELARVEACSFVFVEGGGVVLFWMHVVWFVARVVFQYYRPHHCSLLNNHPSHTINSSSLQGQGARNSAPWEVAGQRRLRQHRAPQVRDSASKAAPVLVTSPRRPRWRRAGPRSPHECWHVRHGGRVSVRQHDEAWTT